MQEFAKNVLLQYIARIILHDLIIDNLIFALKVEIREFMQEKCFGTTLAFYMYGSIKKLYLKEL